MIPTIEGSQQSRRHVLWLVPTGTAFFGHKSCFLGGVNAEGDSKKALLIVAAQQLACPFPAPTIAQAYRKTVTIEVYLREAARLFIEGQPTRSKGSKRHFISPPMPPGKYAYTTQAIIAGPTGSRTVTRRGDVRPGDLESIDLRAPCNRPITDVEYEPTPKKVGRAL